MQKLSNKILKTGLVLLPIFLFALFVAHKKGFLRSDAARVAAQEQKLIDDWKKNSYEPVTNVDKIMSLIESKLQETTNVLTQTQVIELGQTIRSWIQCYSSNSFDGYKRFRFPVTPSSENSKWEPDMIDVYKKILNSTKTPLPERTGDEYKDNLALMEVFYRTAASLTGSTGKSTYCLDCWQGIAIQDIKVIAKKGPEADVGLASMIWGDHNQSASTFVGSLYYDPAPLKTNFTTAFIRLLIDVRPGSSVMNNSVVSAYPVYLSVMWDGKDNCWLPDTFAAGIAQQSVFIF